MGERTLIIHGWSDCSESFKKLKAFLIRQGIGSVETILYADYESREDNITFNDIVDGLHDQLIERELIRPDSRKKHDLNVIVHSTGGLVIRHWIWRYYYRDGDRLADCPVRRLVMLAPANFGSPLAHRGKSFLGSLVKGRWKIGDFLEIGRNLLDGLELASPYQWTLAHRDLLIEKPYYNARQIQTTILAGIEDYAGLRGWVNKPGTDGTVVIAGTSLDSAKLTLDCSTPDHTGNGYRPYRWETADPPDDFAFGVLPGLDHGTIVDEIAPGRDSLVGRCVMEALTAKTPRAFRGLQAKLEAITTETYRAVRKPRFQQFLVHTVDDQGAAVPDFSLEFFVFRERNTAGDLVVRERLTRTESEFSQRIHRAITREFHAHSRDPSYRRFLIDIEEVKAILEEARRAMKTGVVLSLRCYVPPIDRGIRYGTETLQNIVLYSPQAAQTGQPSFLYPDTTTLIELRVDRRTEYVTIGTHPRRH